MHIDTPPLDAGEEPLFRVVYVIDVNAADAQDAAIRAHQIMTDPESMAPVLQVVDHSGNTTVIDLSNSTAQSPAR